MVRDVAFLAVAVGLAVMAVFAGPACAADIKTDPTGRWATEGFGSIVDVRPCAAQPAQLCGRIVWLWAPSRDGRPRLDDRNPDAALRSRPLVGVEIVQGLRQTATGVWSGRLYNPDDGRTYSGELRLADGVLVLRGCALNIVCRSQVWRRPQDVLAAAARAP